MPERSVHDKILSDNRIHQESGESTDLDNPEGVIKFNLDYTQSPLPAPIVDQCGDRLSTLNAWRYIFKQLEMIGEDPHRYNGLGFGNMSIRVQPDQNIFLITGTQTGRIDHLQHQQYSLVTSADTSHNSIVAQGELRPSSEALTHASLYAAKPSVQAVIHIHCPLIWQQAKQLKLLATGRNIAYGTPEMANAVMTLVESIPYKQVILFSMPGHQDGVVAAGSEINAIAQTILHTFKNALKLKCGENQS
ncbi:MAG TPA: class II aldolase/adducin family protein [Crenotrichaceae bacterium]|nr:class II aldolase/adducin family protein [Crenotrichaceae bacterium]